MRRQGRAGATSSSGHPRWPQIVLACPNGVNPAARPDPAGGAVKREHIGFVVAR
jgi:hypothetical protein